MARAVAARIDIPHVELDALHWGPNWTCPPRLEFRALVARALSRESWIVDGNYSKVRDIIWVRADTIVWLDYSLPVTLWRLTRRTLRRLAKREVLWNGNRESWRQQFLSRRIALFVVMANAWSAPPNVSATFLANGICSSQCCEAKRAREADGWHSALDTDIEDSFRQDEIYVNAK